jgi:crotonobetainyl-CoA:carnitine CoA-transferase CaiB-like acyl-CoA transferase
MSALGHLRLLDLSRQLPGPFCSTLLADLGMDVLSIAAPGDVMALGIPFTSRNKRSMTLNLKADAGREVFYRLAAQADVVLEGFRPGVTARLGVDWETLRARNPRLVYCSITGYGQDGPYRDRVGHDINYLGYAGVLEYLGPPDGRPIVPGVQIADIGGGGLMAAVGILTALLARDRTGRGQYIDIAMLDGAVAWNVYHVLLTLLAGKPPARGAAPLGGHHPCYGVYETRDGRHVTLGAYEAHFWATLCRALGREDFVADQWAEGNRRDEMFRFFREKFRTKTLAEWRAELGELEICFGPVQRLDEVFADPHLRHRGMIVDVEVPGGRSVTLGTPIKLSDTPAALRTPPPALGQHTDEVLAGLGLDAAAIARLHADRIV